MVPGRVHTWNFYADQPGIYAGQCAEFCGLSHANMRMEIVALDDADFQTWIDNQLEPYQSPEAARWRPPASKPSCRSARAVTRSTGSPMPTANSSCRRPSSSCGVGAAPNLTNLMTRNTFAGASWDLLTEDCRADVWEASPEEFGDKYLEGVTPSCLNEIDLKEWLRDAPAKKPMYTDPENLEETDGKTRGMPYLALSEDQINELVAYLIERK